MKELFKKHAALILFCVCVLLLLGGVGGAMVLSSSGHLRDSYRDAGKTVIIEQSPVILAAHLEEVIFDGEYTTLSFAPRSVFKGAWEEDAIDLRFVGDHRKQAVNLTPQPEFVPGGDYMLFLQRNDRTDEVLSTYGFAGIFVREADGYYRCTHHTARWTGFSLINLIVDTYILPALRTEIAPTATKVPTPPVTRRSYPTILPTPTPTPTPRTRI